LLDDAANGRDSFADGPFNISAVRKHAAWLHRVVVEFQEMFGHMPDPLFGGELLEVFNTVKDSPALQAITCGLSPPRLRTNSGGGRR